MRDGRAEADLLADVLAYLQEGYRAWQARDIASAANVEQALGLSGVEGLDFHREL